MIAPTSPCNQPITEENFDDLVAIAIIPSSGVEDAILGDPEKDVDRLFVNEPPMQQSPGVSGTNGPAQVAKVAPLLGPISMSPMHLVPLDDHVMINVGVSPAVHSSLDHQINSLVTASGAAPSIKTYFRRGKNTPASKRPDASPIVCREQDLSSADAVEAFTPPPPNLVPVRVVGATVPSPMVHRSVREVFALASVVEDALAPPPAPLSRPVCVVATVAPPLVALVHAESDSLTMMRDGSSSKALHTHAAPAATPIATSAFIAKVTKPVGVVLQRPPSPKPRKKTLPVNFVPKRSRRVAKLPPVFDHKSAATVCR